MNEMNEVAECLECEWIFDAEEGEHRENEWILECPECGHIANKADFIIG